MAPKSSELSVKDLFWKNVFFSYRYILAYPYVTDAPMIVYITGIGHINYTMLSVRYQYIQREKNYTVTYNVTTAEGTRMVASGSVSNLLD